MLVLVDFVTFRRLPNREMDYENGKFNEWTAAIYKTEELAGTFKHVATGHGRLAMYHFLTDTR